MSTSSSNSIVTALRKTENLHIVLWLVKDLCWVSNWHVAGVIMIVPTILVALWLCLRTRRDASEFWHNVAVTCWICANSVWMIGEFYFNDTTRPFAQGFFLLGILALGGFYGYRSFSKN